MKINWAYSVSPSYFYTIHAKDIEADTTLNIPFSLEQDPLCNEVEIFTLKMINPSASNLPDWIKLVEKPNMISIDTRDPTHLGTYEFRLDA